MSFNFRYTFWVNILGIYILLYLTQNFQQHSYRCQNLCQVVQLGFYFQKFVWENVFLKNDVKSLIF